VPPNGFINHSGDDWSCEDGFRKDAGACQPATNFTRAGQRNAE
jgi:hypothetical protein